MATNSSENSISIIGAGFAGLAAGIYAQMNGYKTRIYEMHDKPGGLCTSWERKGYTVDGCIHWLVGSSPDSYIHDLWNEVGVAQGREFICHDEYMHFESPDGRVLTFYTDIDRLEKHLLEFSPGDKKQIMQFIEGTRTCLAFDLPSRNASLIKKIYKRLGLYIQFILKGGELKKWMKITGKEFANGFKDPFLKSTFDEIWIPEFSILFLFFTFAYLHNKNAGYPVGGSMPMSLAMEKRYKDLGGEILYKKRVREIITDNGRAVGIRLSDGTEYRSDIVISAADGYNTIFKMLGGKYIDEKIKNMYEKWPLFHPLIFIGVGVRRKFEDVPHSVSGFGFQLKQPVQIADKMRERISVHLYHHDTSLSPEGCTALTIMLETDYDYWKQLHSKRESYEQKKKEIEDEAIAILEERFPGITSDIEMVNVATPMTFERYTGNWKGSFEGWLITPENSNTIMKPISQTLPGLRNFYMCGQWVEPGGGLPTGLMSGRRLIKSLCRKDKIKFRTSLT